MPLTVLRRFDCLLAPTNERVPIPDFRTVANVRVGHPSPDLLDTLYLCQQRQDWYRDFVRSTGGEPLALVGSVRADEDVVTAAAGIPDACIGLRIKFMTPYEMLRRERARFVLGTRS